MRTRARQGLLAFALFVGGAICALVIANNLRRPSTAQPTGREVGRTASPSEANQPPRHQRPAPQVPPVLPEAKRPSSSPRGGEIPPDIPRAAENLTFLYQHAWRQMESPNVSADGYLAQWVVTAKCAAAARKLASGDYVYSAGESSPGDARETADKTYLGVSDGVGTLVFKFERHIDTDVFAGIDQCSAEQQGAWDREVARFNSQDAAERQRQIQLSNNALKEIRAIHAAIQKGSGAGSDSIERVNELRKNVLPPFMAIKRGSDTVVARRSLGR